MKRLRAFLTTVAMVIVAGTIASAATGGVHGKPTPSPSVSFTESPAPEPTETEAPEPSETEAPEPSESEAPEAEATNSDKSGTAPDFSACDGLTGLDNAICRHEALLKVKPDNPGLTNSLAHLQANAKAEASGTLGHSAQGNSGSHGPSGS